ncbi:MAG: type III-A CRISPR-associated RAMP protein Csm3 [Lachnospiraceae bacterium]|nr:type III-A CRISPR-associated RAMP protein Csm3 [Lachnospiraceae bacterium]
MYAKIQITGTIEVVTGMHIGGSSAFAAIGSVDAPVIRDIRENLPMIPGSSLKGKMRALLAKEYNEQVARTPDEDHERLLRIFGSARKGQVKRSRIQISDMVMKNAKEIRQLGLQSLTEVKFENTINRMTAVANPRQIERVIRGSEFELDMIYEVEKEAEVVEDMEILAEGIKLLQYDYIGGHGSRGYGKIRFKDIQADTVIGSLDQEIEEKINQIFDKVTEQSFSQGISD